MKIENDEEENRLDLYHTWIYENILNTSWFIWVIVYLVLGGNILAPIIIWFVISGKKLTFLHKRKDKGKLSSPK